MPEPTPEPPSKAQEAALAARKLLSFVPCEREVEGQQFTGVACESRGKTLFHHTEFSTFKKIVESGELRPSPDPYDDGVVNFTLNEDFHRFGSVRLLFDREKVATVPMCYLVDEEDHRAARMVDDKIEELQNKDLPYKARNRIAAEIGLESKIAYGRECKHFTAEPVPLQGPLTGLEYWLPWRPARTGNSVGSNVGPCHALWSAWDAGLPSEDIIHRVQDEIATVKQEAQRIGVPFKVKTCYPYASLDRDGVLFFDEENLARLEQGEKPKIVSRYSVTSLPGDCTCPSERFDE